MSLVRLFMKQKSISAEGMSLTLDQTDSVVSEVGWPTSNSDNGINANLLRQNGNRNWNPSQTDNDLAINWVRPDSYNVSGNSSDDIPRQTVSFSTCRELEDVTFNSDSEKFETPAAECKTTGIQAVTEVVDGEMQTSLLYSASASCAKVALHKTRVDEKPVYVVYPNYALPDLSFLRCLDSAENKFDVALRPQSFEKRADRCERLSTNKNMDALKQRGFSHVKDWESLNFLLPNKYKKILHEVPEVSKHIKVAEEARKPLFCLSPPMRHRTRTLTEVLSNNASSSSSSTATQPSSGYRGSSTILSDSLTNHQTSASHINPLYLYRYESVSPEASLCNAQRNLSGGTAMTRENQGGQQRAHLPRGILRKNRGSENKRCSMFEMRGGQVNEVEERQYPTETKRMSLPESYYMNNDLQLARDYNVSVDSEKDVDEAEEQQRGVAAAGKTILRLSPSEMRIYLFIYSENKRIRTKMIVGMRRLANTLICVIVFRR